MKEMIQFTLNGKPVRLDTESGRPLLWVLRGDLNLTGTKYGCGEGECGACTILVDGVPVNSCLMFAVTCDGKDLTTIEGTRGDNGPSILQRAFVERGAVQCGFCTPGLVMQGTYLLNQRRVMTDDEIKRGIEGNLCRCTGYTKIVDAIAFAIRESAEADR